MLIMYSLIKYCIDVFVSTLVFILTFLVTFVALCQIPDRYWLILLERIGWIPAPKLLDDWCENGYGGYTSKAGYRLNGEF